MSQSGVLFLMLFSRLASFGASDHSDWMALSSHLSGQSEAKRQSAIQSLKKIPDIRSILEAEASGPRKFHALEAISAMQLASALPKLKELGPKDESGAVFLTINTLTSDSNLHEVADYYGKVWDEKRKDLSDPALIVLIDTFRTMRACLSEDSLVRLQAVRPAEVRSAILVYARGMEREKRCGTWDKVKANALADKSRQIREQAALP